LRLSSLYEICVIIPSWNSSKAFASDILGIRNEFKVKLMQNDVSLAQIIVDGFIDQKKLDCKNFY